MSQNMTPNMGEYDSCPPPLDLRPIVSAILRAGMIREVPENTTLEQFLRQEVELCMSFSRPAPRPDPCAALRAAEKFLASSAELARAARGYNGTTVAETLALVRQALADVDRGMSRARQEKRKQP